jgi:hypothetical protein
VDQTTQPTVLPQNLWDWAPQVAAGVALLLILAAIVAIAQLGLKKGCKLIVGVIIAIIGAGFFIGCAWVTGFFS